jgi:hypothetical protein
LLDLVDQANERAVELVKQYKRERGWRKLIITKSNTSRWLEPGERKLRLAEAT